MFCPECRESVTPTAIIEATVVVPVQPLPGALGMEAKVHAHELERITCPACDADLTEIVEASLGGHVPPAVSNVTVSTFEVGRRLS